MIIRAKKGSLEIAGSSYSEVLERYRSFNAESVAKDVLISEGFNLDCIDEKPKMTGKDDGVV